MAYAAPVVSAGSTARATAHSTAHSTTHSTASTDAGMAAPSGPWWRHPMMWLVVGGPSLVVVASFITLTLAIRHADPVVAHSNQSGTAHVSAEDAGVEDGTRTVAPAPGSGLAATRQAGQSAGDGADATDPALQPAMRARNHAATGGKEH